MTSDPHRLQRLVDAQAGVIDDVRAELRAGRKRSHWMWFVFPQFRGLGFSAMAARYAIGSRAEALAYLDHPVLGPRLVECTTLVVDAKARTLHELLGNPDDLKFRSSMTLFARIAPQVRPFTAALDRYCDGAHDERTLALLAEDASSP